MLAVEQYQGIDILPYYLYFFAILIEKLHRYIGPEIIQQSRGLINRQ